MKVNNAGYMHYMENISGENKKNVQKTGNSEISSDRIEISNESKKLREYMEQMDSSVDAERVSAIKSAVQSGAYKISSDELAEQIVKKIREQI